MIIDEEEDRYLQVIGEGNKALAKALNKYRPVSSHWYVCWRVWSLKFIKA